MRRFFIFLTILLLSALACSLGNSADPTATSPAVPTPTLAPAIQVSATAVRQSAADTPLPPAATATPPAPMETATLPPATASSLPAATASAVPTAERIVFSTGSTGATVSGAVSAVETDRYLLRALADQIMSVQVTTPSSANLLLTIYGADGTLLKRYAVGEPAWSGPLPSTQDYVIGVRTAGESSAAEYTLEIEISPLSVPPVPERITFPAGATGTTITGTLAAQGDVKQYLLAAQAGQRIDVAVTSDAPGIIVYSLRDGEGQTLAISSDPTPLVAFLPETGDYLITLTTHNIAPAVDYSVDVAVVNTDVLPEPERIQFAGGTTGTTITGTIPSGGSRLYILRALGGQTMTLDVSAEPAGALRILVETEGGSFLAAGSDAAPLALTLPTTQDYLIVMTTPLAAPAVSFEVAVQIE